MHVGMRLIGVKDEREAVLEGELLARKVARGLEYPLRRRTGRHRKHDLVNELRRPSGTGCERRVPPVLIQVEIPVLDQPLPRISSLQSVAVVRLQFQLATAANVVQ